MRRALVVFTGILLLSGCRSVAWSEFIFPCGSSRPCVPKRPCCTHYKLCGFSADGTAWVCERQTDCKEDLKPFDQPPQPPAAKAAPEHKP